MPRLMLLLIVSSVCFAQQTEQPRYMVAAGAGWNHYSHPKALGWTAIATRLNTNVYSFTSLVMTPQKSTLLTGLAPMLYSDSIVRLFAFGQAGVETGEGVVQDAYSGGGFGVINVGRWIRAKPIDLVAGVKIGTPNNATSPATVKPVFFLGIGWHSGP